jgi:hypothetical protein
MHSGNVAMMTSRQWFERPDDQKFSSLEELYAFLADRKARSRQVDKRLSSMHFRATDNNDIEMVTKDGMLFTPTNWSFHQMANLVGGHPTLLSKLKASTTSLVLNELYAEHLVEKKNRNMGLMVIDDPKRPDLAVLQGFTGATYGRIWDAEIAQAAMEILDLTGGRFYSPHDWGGIKRALFASDRDIHMLFIDGGSILDAGITWDHKPDVLHRGWIIGNSEVGLRAMYIATFLFRIVCGNFCIHGITDVNFKSIRHTPGAPMKFVKEAVPALKAYVDEAAGPMETVIKKAKQLELPQGLEEHTRYFRARDFTANETAMARMVADREEGGHYNLYQMVNGFTKYAQKITYRDIRVNLETRAGKLLENLAA